MVLHPVPLHTLPLHLVPIAPDRFPAWLDRSQQEYTTDLVAAGESPESARRHAEESLEKAFPSKAPTEGNSVFDVIDDEGQAVGYLWIGHDNSGDSSSWWIWDIVVDAEHRGKGYGRATMELGEDYARSQGAQSLGLSVFGFNSAARGLYESLGYETTTVKMRKSL